MIATLRNRNFFLLWSGGLISMIGTWMLLAALPFYIYSVTGSALATSGLLMAYLAPGALFGSIAGVFVDRWDRKRVLVIGNLIQAAIIPVLLLVDANGWIWLVYVVAFLESTVNQFLGPAENLRQEGQKTRPFHPGAVFLQFQAVDLSCSEWLEWGKSSV